MLPVAFPCQLSWLHLVASYISLHFSALPGSHDLDFNEAYKDERNGNCQPPPCALNVDTVARVDSVCACALAWKPGKGFHVQCVNQAGRSIFFSVVLSPQHDVQVSAVAKR